jgi:hypothetical protein
MMLHKFTVLGHKSIHSLDLELSAQNDESKETKDLVGVKSIKGFYQRYKGRPRSGMKSKIFPLNKRLRPESKLKTERTSVNNLVLVSDKD